MIDADWCGPMGLVSKVPPRSVTVWGRSALFVQVTVVPTATLWPLGW